MANEVDFLPFATGGSANVEDQQTWVSDSVVANGFSAGIAPSAKFNKALRQGTFGVAAIATWISNVLGISVLDDGNLSEFVTNFGNAVAGTATNGSLIAVRKFTASGAYTPTAGTSFIEVEIIGGGGGGGGSPAMSASQFAAAGGGACGGRTKGIITTGFEGQAITIGTGGPGGAGNATGSAGGTTSFMGLSATGGSGGSPASPAAIASVQLGGLGGSGSGGSLINANGDSGQPGIAFGNANMVSGGGASSEFGGGGAPLGSTTADGNAGSGFGAGGSGAMTQNSGAQHTGGAGTPGIVIIREYA